MSDRPARLARSTRRLEIISGLLSAGTLSLLEMGPGLAKKGFGAADYEVALLTSGQSLGLLFSFFAVHLSRGGSYIAISSRLQFLSNLCFCGVFFLKPGFALGYVLLHASARIAWSMSLPLRVEVYRANFPDKLRGRIVGRIRQLQLTLATVAALLLSLLLDWNMGEEFWIEILGDCPVATRHMIFYVIPVFACFGLFGSAVYRSIPEATPPSGHRSDLRETLADFFRVLRDDKDFRRYEFFFFVFGFSNIMTLPVVQIYVVDEMDASYFDLAMINVVIVHGFMALSTVWWGARVDRHRPWLLRAVLNWILALDLVVLALAPNIGWVYVGRIFRGIALGGGSLVWMLGALYFARGRRNPAVYTAIHIFLTGIRFGLAPFFGVYLKGYFENQSRPIFWIAVGILTLTGFGMFREERRSDRGDRGRQRSGSIVR